MKLAFELYTQKLLSIKTDTYFKTSLFTCGSIISQSAGHDIYRFPAIITSDKRLAGLGRESIYTLSSFPLGMGGIEAYPGNNVFLESITDEVKLFLKTNLFSDPGVLADSIGVRLISEKGGILTVPFCSPDILIVQDASGQFRIPIGKLLHNKMFKEVASQAN